ncbi:MAG TPA: aspartate/glutamate racemase family protein [Candidatus Dormibacteraeota bacterium]|nr:aspartate/glutamate racemase family protein [Candidatus Dormibacteraeota bacterium]
MPSDVYTGGKNVYGFPLGILMLESRFPRIPGDVGNASTWPFPVLYRVVEGAGPARVVRSLKESGLVDAFVTGAQELVRAGVSIVTTNCGFLVLHQRQIQRSIGVPFLSSSLLQVPFLQSLLPPGRRVGVLTIERRSLSDEHLAAAGIAGDIPIVGMEEVGGYFVEVILGDGEELDVARARDEHVQAARLLLRRHPEVGAIVLECTNMPPYAAAIREETGLPVHDLTTFVGWALAAERRREFEGWM